MSELVESKNQNLTLSLTENEKKYFSEKITKYSVAKSLVLGDGQLKCLFDCAAIDVEAGIFSFEDFISGIEAAIRIKNYNRVDYADLYAEAVMIADERIQKGAREISSMKLSYEEEQALIKNKFPSWWKTVIAFKKISGGK